MASDARVFTCCRALFAATPKSTATFATTTTTTVAKKKTAVEKSTKKPAKNPKPEKPVKPVGILKPTPISPALADFLGVHESARTYAIKKIWEHIKSNELQDPMNKKVIICDDKLKKIFDGKDTVGFIEISKLLGPHFVKTA